MAFRRIFFVGERKRARERVSEKERMRVGAKQRARDRTRRRKRERRVLIKRIAQYARTKE